QKIMEDYNKMYNPPVEHEPGPSLKKSFSIFGTYSSIFHNHCKQYPSPSQGIRAFFKKPKDLNCKNYPEGGFPLAEQLLKDPWGTPYKYKNIKNKIDLLSAGPDRVWGSEDDASYQTFERK
ncbi:MAG: type II secretion system protein GspG, partial [Halobacteriovoraceae bacterium]|nr:type II secretion system protein GspG [Halobacteriovoraceae bacterium]